MGELTLLLGVLSLLAAACGQAATAEIPEAGEPAGCIVTSRPSPGFMPPSPYPSEPPAAGEGQFWYGTAALWTALNENGIWTGLPQGDGGYGQKVFWWAKDYSASDEPKPDLVVTGRRLDGEANPLTASEPTNAYGDFGEAMLVGVVIPAEGCWEIKGTYRGNQLRFVVQVTP